MPHERKRPFTENMNTDASSFSSRYPPESSDFGRYCNLRIIGEGGMGRVYLAFDPMLGIELAVKVLPRGIHSSKEEHRRFKREIQLLAAINIPGVVRLFDCGECEGWQYYTMEYVDGAAIDDYCEAKGLSQRQRLDLILSLADILAQLHASDIIHRDIKPSNILVTEDGSVRLTDFGIAKSFDHSQQHSAITLNDTRPGTPFYMSPESSSSLRDRGMAMKADVYSLGVVAYELLTGRLPYDVENLSATECVLVIREEEPHSFADRRAIIAPQLEMVIMAALNKDPDKRPDAAALADMLRQAMDGGAPSESPKTGISRWATIAAAILIGIGIMLLHSHLSSKRDAANARPGDQQAQHPTDDDTSAGATDMGTEPDADGSKGDAVAHTDAPQPETGGNGTTDVQQPPTEPPAARFKRVLAAAHLALAEERWDEATAAYVELTNIPGFETAEESRVGLTAVSCAKLMQKATAAAGRKEWPTVKRLTQEVLGLDPTNLEASVLRQQATVAMVPKASLSAWYDGKEVKGARILIDGVPMLQTTPLSTDLNLVDGKRITILAPRTPTVLFLPAETTWKDVAGNTLKVELDAINSVLATDVNMTMLPVGAGSFSMGDNAASSRENPVHTVTLTDDFWISEHEISQDQYFVITRQNPSKERGQNFPVVNVSWYEAVDFCKKLTAREQKAGRLPEGYVYRLPTESEWEYCARAGTAGPYPFEKGAVLASRIAAKESNLKQYAEIKYGKPNPWGIYNMNGNVREWVFDSYSAYDARPRRNPLVHSRSSSRVVRGGSWLKPMARCTVTYRDRSISGLKHFSDVGFRIVLAAPLK